MRIFYWRVHRLLQTYPCLKVTYSLTFCKKIKVNVLWVDQMQGSRIGKSPKTSPFLEVTVRNELLQHLSN